MAKKHSQTNSKDFWSEVKSLNNSNIPLPSSIGDANCPEDILQLWKEKF